VWRSTSPAQRGDHLEGGSTRSRAPLTQAGIPIKNQRNSAQETELAAFVAILTDFTQPPTPDSPMMTTLKKFCYSPLWGVGDGGRDLLFGALEDSPLGTGGCRARAAIGHATAPPSPAMNSRHCVSVGEPIAVWAAVEKVQVRSTAPCVQGFGRRPTTRQSRRASDGANPTAERISFSRTMHQWLVEHTEPDQSISTRTTSRTDRAPAPSPGTTSRSPGLGNGLPFT
jgi:hypothetical protein